MKMTATEYLTARGWTLRDFDGEGVPVQEWTTYQHPGECYPIGEAVGVQRAIDAAEERRAWVAFAAGAAAVPDLGEHQCADCADILLAAYRARFAVEIVDEPVTP